MNDKDKKETIEEYIERRFRRKKPGTDPILKKRKRKNAGIVLLNVVLVIFMLLIYRSHETTVPQYYTKSSRIDNASYRFSLSADRSGNLTAGLTVKNLETKNTPLLLDGTVATITISHKGNELILVPVTSGPGRISLDPGKSKSFIVRIDTTPLLHYAKTTAGSIEAKDKFSFLSKSRGTMALSSRMIIRRQQPPASIAIDFKYEVPK